MAAAYMDKSGRMVGRTELERRNSYMQEVRRQFREGHPLVQMIRHCLKNRVRERPTIQQVMGWLEEARAEIEDNEYDIDKLSLAQLLHSRNLYIHQQQQQIYQKEHENYVQKQQIDQLNEQSSVKDDQILSLQDEVQSLRAENAALKMLTPTSNAMSGASSLSSVRQLYNV